MHEPGVSFRFVRFASRHSPWGLSTFLINPRKPLSRSSAGEERGLVNSPDAMRSSRVLARHGVAARRRGSVTPAARPDPRNDSDPKPRIARPAPRLEREDAERMRARPSVGALPEASDDCITTGSGRARLSSKSPGAYCAVDVFSCSLKAAGGVRVHFSQTHPTCHHLIRCACSMRQSEGLFLSCSEDARRSRDLFATDRFLRPDSARGGRKLVATVGSAREEDVARRQPSAVSLALAASPPASR